MTPAASAFSSLKSFMASRTHSDLSWNDRVADVDEGGGSRAGSTVEDADHRRLDANHAVTGHCRDPGASLVGVDARGDGHRDAGRRLVGASDRDAHALVLDLDLPHATLLHDLHELSDALTALGVGVLGDQHRLARMARANDLQQLLGVRSEHRDEDELLLARSQALGLLADVFGRHRILRELHARREELDRALDGRVDRLRRHAVAALHELAELVDDGAVATRLEHVKERLRRQDLADRSRERRPAGLGANAPHLLEHLQQSIRRGMRAQMHVERRHQPGGKVVLGRANGDPRRDLRHRLVADVLVDDVRGLPELRNLEPRGVAEPLQRLRDRLARYAVKRERERIDRRCDEVGARVDRRERGRESDACRPLHIEADRKPARLHDPCDELLCLVGEQRARRVVHEDPRRAEIRQLPRLLDERVRLVGAPRAVDEPGVESTARARDRGSRLTQVGDVVQRVVKAEDPDSVLGRARHEPADDVAAHGARADQEAPAQRDSQRSRDARLDRADPLPRALDATAHRRVEHATARDLEAGESGSVEDLRDAKDFRRGQLPRKGLLREQPDGRVDEPGHGSGP